MTRRADQLAPASAAVLLTEWRQAERGRALLAGSREGAALHARMRDLMDEYDWVVGGRVGRWPVRGIGTRRLECFMSWPS